MTRSSTSPPSSAEQAEDDQPIEDVLAAARPADSPASMLARARIAGQLFGAVAPGLGRFRVLERLGGGGMGVVYAAYDPELDRGVALKTVQVPQGGRELALSEAKALARLSHPNVVPVFDVGIEQGHVYIVMELVRGAMLRDWVKDKPQSAILDVYRQAGHALAAAHASGLVHRDFKPDNAIVGLDGRVRVVDFGLACEAALGDDVTAKGRGAGTPKYMAPEQAAGIAVTPAADQYSFSVSLAEALPAPRPRWISEIVERGIAADPAARFRSMHELLRALGRDPVRVRRRRAIASAVGIALVGVAAVAFLVGRGRSSQLVEICGGGDREIAAAWTRDARVAQLAKIASLSTYGHELAPQLEQQLAEYQTHWLANHRDACMAHRAGLQSDVLLDRRMACLDQSRAGLAAFAEIAAAATPGNLPDIALAIRAVPDPDACSDVSALAADVEPAPPAAATQITVVRREIERARVQIAAGQFDEARKIVDHAVSESRTIGYRPVLAEALLVEGHVLMAMDDKVPASARLAEATNIALASREDAVGVEAWARRAWVVGTSDQLGDALAGVEVVDALATRSSAPFARSLLHNNIGGVELARGHHVQARAAFERALSEARFVKGPGAVELLAIRRNMALVAENPRERDRLLVDARAEVARMLGPDHPDSLFAEFLHATSTVVSMPRAAELLTSVCTRNELHETLAGRTAQCWTEVADLRFEVGDRAGASAALTRVIDLGARTLEEIPEVAGYASLWAGDRAGAEKLFVAALERLPPAPDEAWYITYVRAKLQLGLGRARATRPREARIVLAAAVDSLEKILRDHPAVAVERRLGRARAELARMLAATHADPSATASAALSWLRPAGAADAAELDALTAPAGLPTERGRGSSSP
jgi:tetratricopeptide (TPR) repeat protein/predicted Ser/Thr protein kinase